MEGKPGDLEDLAATTAEAIERESAPKTVSKDPGPAAEMIAPPTTEDVPDPDEDDLDDLDDMLDEFIPTKPEPKATTTSGPGRPPTTTTPAPALPGLEALGEGISDDDFAKQLQAGMAELMGGLETSPDMQAQFENMLKELGGAAAGLGVPGPSAPTSSKDKSAITVKKAKTPTGGSTTDGAFQDTIAKTMERMRTSGDQATAAAASDNRDDMLTEMMKAMQAGGMDGEGGEEEFSKMLLGMMEQLTNKEILYEPMKELDDKFPAWMEKNAGKVEEADMKRYKEQQIHVREIVKRFETKGYKDDNAADREYIVERMQKMQAAGSPPEDLVGDMAAAQEAFGAPEEGCPTQ